MQSGDFTTNTPLFDKAPTCRVCSQKFQSFDDLKKHIRIENHHNASVPNKQSNNNDGTDSKPFGGNNNQMFRNNQQQGFPKFQSPFMSDSKSSIFGDRKSFSSTDDAQKALVGINESSTSTAPFSSPDMNPFTNNQQQQQQQQTTAPMANKPIMNKQLFPWFAGNISSNTNPNPNPSDSTNQPIGMNKTASPFTVNNNFTTTISATTANTTTATSNTTKPFGFKSLDSTALNAPNTNPFFKQQSSSQFLSQNDPFKKSSDITATATEESKTNNNNNNNNIPKTQFTNTAMNKANNPFFPMKSISNDNNNNNDDSFRSPTPTTLLSSSTAVVAVSPVPVQWYCQTCEKQCSDGSDFEIHLTR